MARKTKQQMLNMQAQLEHIGLAVERFSKLAFNCNQIDTIGIEFGNTLRDLDGQQNCNKYIWKGLPDYLASWLIEYMLYLRGSLCGFISGGILYILPYAQTKGINVYGLPNAVQPITFNGQLVAGVPTNFGKELIVSDIGSFNKKATACILYDRIPVYSTNSSPLSRAQLNDILIEYQSQILGRIKNNLRNVDKKSIFYVDDEKQKNQTEKDLREAYGRDDPFIVVVKGSNMSGNGDTRDTLQPDISNETQSLFEAWQSINSIRCMCSGIANGGAFEKKERKITGELDGASVQTDIVVDAGLQMRRLFIAQMRAIYPNEELLKNITVEINEKTIEFEEDDTDKSTGVVEYE